MRKRCVGAFVGPLAGTFLAQAACLAQGAFLDECKKVEQLTKFLNEHAASGETPDREFLKRLRAARNDAMRFSLGLQSCVYGSSLHQTEADTLWIQDARHFTQHIIPYLAGKFVGSKLLNKYKYLDQNKNTQSDDVFILSKEDFQQLVAIGTTKAQFAGRYQNYVKKAVAAESVQAAVRAYVQAPQAQQQVRQFEVILALQYALPWFCRYVEEERKESKMHFEEAARTLPIRVLVALAKVWGLAPETYAEAICAYALAVSKDPSLAPELDQLTNFLIQTGQEPAFLRFLDLR